MNIADDDADYSAERAERIREMLSTEELEYLRRLCRKSEENKTVGAENS